MSEETRELIISDDIAEDTYLRYCPCTKDLCSIRECTCNYSLLLGGCFIPAVVTDSIMFIPQVIINNIKLCFK